MKNTGMTHLNCGGRIELYQKTLLGVTGKMYICAKCKNTVPVEELQHNPIAPHMVNRSR